MKNDWESAEATWRRHNEPINPALGPCRCPVCAHYTKEKETDGEGR